MTATILKPQVRKALLKNLRAKQSSKNKLLQKGFTLVELMIVIVIVGILSAVALPNFLAQTDKAKATEAKSQIAAALKRGHADYQETDVSAYTATDLGLNATKYFTYACNLATATAASCTATGTADSGNLSTLTIIGTLDFTTNDNIDWTGTATTVL
jgi:type IV pilus assembly protein PilA